MVFPTPLSPIITYFFEPNILKCKFFDKILPPTSKLGMLVSNIFLARAVLSSPNLIVIASSGSGISLKFSLCFSNLFS